MEKSKYMYIFAVLRLVVLFTFTLSTSSCKNAEDAKQGGVADIHATGTEDGVVTSTPMPTVTVAPTATMVPTATPTPTPTPIPIYMPEVVYSGLPEGMTRSSLTGEWIDEAAAMVRPFAVIFNNLGIASPHSGIGDADILYEALVEAGITRLLGIYGSILPDSQTASRLGSIRSSRHYFASIASEYDAIYVHYGGTSYSDRKIKSLALDEIDGMKGYGVNSFYRDKAIKAPHNAFASLDGILKGMERGKMRTELEEGYNTHFGFYGSDVTLSDGVYVSKVVLPFSSGMQPYLIYDEEGMDYTRYQFNKVHTDYNTGEALRFKNVIIQFVREWDIDKNGYQTMELEDVAGEGYYMTNGKMVPITWYKNEKDRFMKYYGMDGNELVINVGKTYIAVFPNHRADRITVEE